MLWRVVVVAMVEIVAIYRGMMLHFMICTFHRVVVFIQKVVLVLCKLFFVFALWVFRFQHWTGTRSWVHV